MRTDTSDFKSENESLSKSARFVLQIAFDTASTDLVYFKSHADASTPDGVTVSNAVVMAAPSLSQSLNPIKANSSIGNIVATIQDTGSALTALIKAHLDTDEGLRHKRIRLYIGYRGLPWSDYSLFQTQIIDSYSYLDGIYKFNCKDIQRSTKKYIFDIKKTTLTDTIDELLTTTTIGVTDTTDFSMVFHGTSYSDAPSSTVGYFKIDDEVISYTGKTSTTFTGCVRGRLNTKPARHETDPNLSTSRRKKVEEFIYLELPAVKLLYAVLTGDLYGDAATLPDHWHLGISTDFVSTAKFIAIGADLWDTTDDTLGMVSMFQDLKKIDGKKFYETKINRMIGCFTPVLSTGELGIKRLANILHDASYIKLLNSSNIISYSGLTHDLTQVQNNFVVNWNYLFASKEFSRQNIITDATSQTRWGASDPIVMDMEGLDGSRHTNSILNHIFNFLRDRYAGPPKLWNVEVLFSMNGLEVGDVIRGQLDQVRDSSLGTSTLDSSFEIQRKSINTENGTVNLSLFGSSEPASPISPTSGGTALADAVYSTASLNPTNKLDNTPGSPAITTTLTGGVLHIDGSGTLAGQATLPGASNIAIYWYDDDVQIDAGITLTVTENVILMVMGNLQINGTLTGKGQGIAASTAGTAGYIGNTLAGGTLYERYAGGLYVAKHLTWHSAPRYFNSDQNPTLVEGANAQLPEYNLAYDGLTLFSGITGLPTDLRGSSGSQGGAYAHIDAINTVTVYPGGAGGAGGAGLIIISRGVTVSGSGYIDLSGADGSPGTAVAATLLPTWVGVSSSGAGGAAGGLLVLLDGTSAVETDVTGTFVANNGESPLLGAPLPVLKNNTVINLSAGSYSSFYTPLPQSSYKLSNHKIRYVPASETAVADESFVTSKPSSVVVAEVVNTPPTPGENLASITVTATPPADTNYSHINVYWKLSSAPDTAYEFGGVGTNVAVLVAPMDGSAYDIKSVPVSIYGIESTDFEVDSITLSNQAGGVNLATGNYISSGQAAYDIGTGFYIANVGGTPKLSLGDSTGNKVTWDGSTLSIVGTITATVGVIGGWTIGATALTAGSGGTTVGLDSGGTNPALYAGSATPASAPFRVTNAGALVATSATITGAITATSGAIAGWTISTSEIVDSSGRIHIDHGNARIRMEGADANDYVQMSASGLIGVDSVLGTVFQLLTDGSAPIFSSGIINTTIFNVSTSGILRTSSTVGDGTANSDGVLINDTGIKGFPVSSSSPTFFLDATDGSLVLSGATNIALDSTTGAISIGSATYGNAGIQLQYNAGTERFYVGDGADKSFQFDGTDVILGKLSTIKGSDAYANDNIYLSSWAGELPFYDGSTGGGSSTASLSAVDVYVATSGVGRYEYATGLVGLVSSTWSKNRRWKVAVWAPGNTNNDFEVGCGILNGGTDRSASFIFDTDGNIYSRTCDGTTCATPVSLTTWSTSGAYKLEFIFNAGTNVEFYVNGSLLATMTSNIPSTAGDSVLLAARMAWSASTTTASIGQFKFLQDA